MNSDDAIRLLGLRATPSPADVDEAFATKETALRARIDKAPTATLKTKYENELRLHILPELGEGMELDQSFPLSFIQIDDDYLATPVELN